MLLVQMAVFFIAKYTDVLNKSGILPTTTSSVAITSPTTMSVAVPTTMTSNDYGSRNLDYMQYATGLAVFLGLTFSILLAMVLWLIVKIMLVGRLIGVSRLTSAFIWSLVIVLLLFPWQAFLGSAQFHDPSFKLPGVIYTWPELMRDAKLGTPGNTADMPRLDPALGSFRRMAGVRGHRAAGNPDQEQPRIEAGAGRDVAR